MIDGAPQYPKRVGLAELTGGNLFLFRRSGAMHSCLIGQELPFAPDRPAMPMFPNNCGVPNRNGSVAERSLFPYGPWRARLLLKVTLGCVTFDSLLTLAKSGGDTSK